MDGELSTLATLSAYGTNDAGERNSFIQTYRELPLDTEHPLGIMVTTYNGMPDAEPDLRVDPELFREFAYEGVFKGGFPDDFPAGLKGVDLQNAQNPVPNPDGKPGDVFWIDSDYASRYNPSTYVTLSEEQQLYIKDVIEREVLSHFKDETHKPQIYLAQPGQDLPKKEGETAMIPDYGVVFVTHRKGGEGYGFGWTDYENNGVQDGIVDAARATIGNPPNLDGKIVQEAGSIIVLNPINNDALKGKTAFSEGGTTGFFTPADKKILAMQENMSAKENPWQTFQLEDGTYITRGHYKPLTQMDDILGN